MATNLPYPPSGLKLRSSRLRFLFLLGVSLAFSAAGVGMIRDGHVLGWLVFLFFGAGVVVFFLSLLPGSSYLELDSAGFTVCALFKPRTTRWHEVTAFRVGRVGTRKSVVFDFTELQQGRALAREAAALLEDCEGALPGTYGLSAEELAQVMEEWRRRWQQSSPKR
jgi:hypothetical protein